jgi:hypothetical protein
MSHKEQAEQLWLRFSKTQEQEVSYHDEDGSPVYEIPKREMCKRYAIITQQEKIDLLKKHSRSIGISIELEHQTAILTELQKL